MIVYPQGVEKEFSVLVETAINIALKKAAEINTN